MKLTDRPTPRTDNCSVRPDLTATVNCAAFVPVEVCRSLEQQLAHAVEALEFGDGLYDDSKSSHENALALYEWRNVAKQALAEIAAAQEGRVG